MTPTVFASLWGDNPLYSQFAELWKTTWARNGWNPVTLHPDLGRDHPAYHLLLSFCNNFPWPDSERAFQSNCVLRWCAFAVAMRNASLPWALHCDIDCLNRSLPPTTANAALHPSSATLIPGAAILASISQAWYLPFFLLPALPAAVWFQGSLPKTSDVCALLLLASSGALRHSPPWAEIATPTSPGYSPSFPLVHFPNNTCPNRLTIASRYVKEWGATSELPPPA